MSAAAMLQRAQIANAARAYVAPIDRNSGAIAFFDPAAQGQFALDSPPPPFVDLGWVENFQRASPTRHEAIRGGPRGAVSTQYCAQMEALVEFDLPAWGKLQMALANGSQQWNVLAIDQLTPPQPSGGAALPPAYLLDDSTVMELSLAPDDLARFAAGDIVAVDADYDGASGYIGAGIPGMYLAAPLDAVTHKDLVRRITFNVSRVTRKTPYTLELTPPLPARLGPGFGVQKVVAFVDREGGSAFQEWSGLFIVQGEAGGRVCFFYPRLQVAASACETRQELASPLFQHMLHASLRALPSVDPNDGETVLCYRSYFPAEGAGL